MEWEKRPLGEIIQFKNGKKRPANEGNIPVYGGNGVLGYTANANYERCVVVGRVGAYCGSVYYEADSCWVSDNAIAALPKNGTDIVYAYYLLKSLNLNEYRIGTSQPLLTQEILNHIECRIPLLSEQQQIASVLRALDQKIVTNNKINDNLHEQALTLFAKYYAQATHIVPFTSVIQILSGGTPKTGNAAFWNGTIPFFTPKDVEGAYTLFTEKTITEEGLAHCNSRLYPINTVFVTARGTVGKVSLAGVPMAMNQSCYALVGKGIDQIMVYFYTLQSVQALKSKASGVVFDAIITRDFETETVKLIATDDEGELLKVVKPMFEQMLINRIANQRLAALRDSLLPKLITGEIDVSDIDI